MYSQPELIYSIACSAYVVTCLMFAALRWFHVCPGAKENSTTVQLFRSRRTCTAGLVDRSKNRQTYYRIKKHLFSNDAPAD